MMGECWTELFLFFVPAQCAFAYSRRRERRGRHLLTNSRGEGRGRRSWKMMGCSAGMRDGEEDAERASDEANAGRWAKREVVQNASAEEQ